MLDVLSSVKSLDADHASSSTCRSISQRIGPFLSFLERHSRAVDTMMQCHPTPAALIWGLCRIVLQVRISCRLEYHLVSCQGHEC